MINQVSYKILDPKEGTEMDPLELQSFVQLRGYYLGSDYTMMIAFCIFGLVSYIWSSFMILIYGTIVTIHMS